MEDIKTAFNLSPSGFPNSIDFYSHEADKTETNFSKSSYNKSLYKDFKSFPEALVDFKTEFSALFLTQAITDFDNELNNANADVRQQLENEYKAGRDVAFGIRGSTIIFGDLKSPQINDLTKFLSVYYDSKNDKSSNDLDLIKTNLEKEISSKYSLDNPPTDLLECFAQYWNAESSTASTNVNNKYVGEFKDFLNQSNKNSVVFIAHSQGNFFLEDALTSSLSGYGSNRIKVISLGSPTQYSQISGFDIGYKNDADPFDNKNIDIILRKHGNDPVTGLRFDYTKLDSKEKFKYFLTNLDNIVSISGIGKGLALDHSLNGFPFLQQGYIQDSLQGRDFINLFNAANPFGYYFPNFPIESSGTGTYDGDWLQGSGGSDDLVGLEGNDVIRGNEGDDELTGNKGWDFLDGGSGKDTASYQDSGGGITVIYNRKDGFDIYEVKDGYNYQDILGGIDGYPYQDILGGIEEIKGSNHSDKFFGGYGKDVFYGLDGSDDFVGEGGDDYFEGGTGDDNFWGGSGNDTFNDDGIIVDFGGSGNDYFDGGSGDDTFYGAVVMIPLLVVLTMTNFMAKVAMIN